MIIGSCSSGRMESNEGLRKALEVMDKNSFELFLMENFIGYQDVRKIPFCSIKLVYIQYILNKYNSTSGYVVGEGFLKMFHDMYCGDVVCDCDLADVRDEDVTARCIGMAERLRRTGRTEKLLMKCLEKETRGQVNNVFWHILRKFTLTATKFFTICTSRIVPGESLAPYSGDASMFGNRHEGLVKCLVETWVEYKREPIKGGLGLLIDPTSGLLGASIDLCYGVDEFENLLTVGEGARIYEIKCRYKYLRTRDDSFVQALLQDPSEQSFARFILSHPVPGIEYKEKNSIPFSKEFLVTRDVAYRLRKRKRACTLPAIIKKEITDIISLNENERSLVVLFDCVEKKCSDGGTAASVLELFERKRFNINAFINPRHTYFYQVLIQQYILSQYYIRDHVNPEEIRESDLPVSRIVSAILRKRSVDEEGLILHVGTETFLSEDIPLAIIVTPVVFDPKFVTNSITSSIEIWQKDLARRTGLSLWVRSAVSEYAASYLARPQTP